MEKQVFQSEVLIAASNPDFEGHFPNAPIFPAVSQIELVVNLLREHFGEDLVSSGIKKAKFKSILRPDTRVLIELVVLSKHSGRWIIKDAAQVYSSGDITFTLPG